MYNNNIIIIMAFGRIVLARLALPYYNILFTYIVSVSVCVGYTRTYDDVPLYN